MYDLIIIGAGPAGIAASIYASRYKLDHLIFDENPGGQVLKAGNIENYPGFTLITGPELVSKFIDQVSACGVEIKRETVLKIEKTGEGFKVSTNKQGVYEAKSLILALGASYRKLEIPGEEEFIGRGVSYCTNCDAPFFREKTVAVVGGGNSAVSGALHAALFATKVYLIHRRDEFRADPSLVEKIKQNSKIEVIFNNAICEIVDLTGNKKVEEIVLEKAYLGQERLKIDGVFIEIGHVPSSTLASELGVKVDERGYIEVGVKMETNIAGVYAAGDLALLQKDYLFHQIISACCDGARAAASVYNDLKHHR